ncbi:hypothetical protein Hanom_Chr17g01555951 [Helianthus anomalus]
MHICVTPRFPRVSPVGPVGDYRDVVGNNIVKPHNYMNAQRKQKINILRSEYEVISSVTTESKGSTGESNQRNCSTDFRRLELARILINVLSSSQPITYLYLSLRLLKIRQFSLVNTPN